MKQIIGLWELRWFVALFVFAGMLIGFGAGVLLRLSQSVETPFLASFGKWILGIGLVLYLVVVATLGRGYRRLIRTLS